MNTFEYRDTDNDELTIRGDDGNVYVIARANDDGYIAQVAIPNDDAPALALAILEHAGYAEGLGEYDPGEMRAPVHVAVERLRMVQVERTKRVERDAEIAEARRFAEVMKPGVAIHRTPTSEVGEGFIDRWVKEYRAAREFFTRDEGGLGRRPEEIQPGESLQSWAKRLRERTDERERRIAEARDEKAFETEHTPDIDGNCPGCDKAAAQIPARILQYGDPEPDHSTQWRETDGTVWKWQSPSESKTSVAGWTPTSGPSVDLHFDWGHRRMSFPMTEVTDRV